MISHRYDRLPLLSSDPGGVQRELVVPYLPGTKVLTFDYSQRKVHKFYSVTIYRIIRL